MAGIDLSNEALAHHRVEDPLKGFPREVRAVHDPSWFARPILNYPKDIQVNFQLRSSACHRTASDQMVDLFQYLKIMNYG